MTNSKSKKRASKRSKINRVSHRGPHSYDEMAHITIEDYMNVMVSDVAPKLETKLATSDGYITCPGCRKVMHLRFSVVKSKP